MQIVISNKSNQKLLQHYPDDPYSNLTIVTQTRKLNLQLAYLSIDSTFFSNMDPDTRQISLAYLSQQPLLRVIRSLYGQPLIAYSILQLSQLYKIIKQLQVDEYIENIKTEIISKPNILQSLEFLQFSFANDILKQQVIYQHIDNQLKLLQSNRNYLQLNKISLNTFQILLQNFTQAMIKKYHTIDLLLLKPQAQIINHVMQNYFNRNNIKPLNYFKQSNPNPQTQNLQFIWNKYHHSFLFNTSSIHQQPISSSKGFGNSMTNLSSVGTTSTQFLSVKNLQQAPRKKSQQIIHVALNPSYSSKQSQIQKKKQKLLTLQSKIKQRDQTIAELQNQIDLIKKSHARIPPKSTKRTSGGSTGSHNIPKTIDEEQLMKESTSEQSLSFLPAIKKIRKSKQYEDQQDFTVSSVFEPAFNVIRKIPQMKEVRTMKKTPNVKTKFLPN